MNHAKDVTPPRGGLPKPRGQRMRGLTNWYEGGKADMKYKIELDYSSFYTCSSTLVKFKKNIRTEDEPFLLAL